MRPSARLQRSTSNLRRRTSETTRKFSGAPDRLISFRSSSDSHLSSLSFECLHDISGFRSFFVEVNLLFLYPIFIFTRPPQQPAERSHLYAVRYAFLYWRVNFLVAQWQMLHLHSVHRACKHFRLNRSCPALVESCNVINQQGKMRFCKR